MHFDHRAIDDGPAEKETWILLGDVCAKLFSIISPSQLLRGRPVRHRRQLRNIAPQGLGSHLFGSRWSSKYYRLENATDAFFQRVPSGGKSLLHEHSA